MCMLILTYMYNAQNLYIFPSTDLNVNEFGHPISIVNTSCEWHLLIYYLANPFKSLITWMVLGITSS